MPALPRRRHTHAGSGTAPTGIAPTGTAPWIRTRLRAAPGATLALSLLVLITAFLAAALPRAVDVQEDSALRDTVAGASVAHRSVTATLDVSWLSFPYDAKSLVTPRSLTSTESTFQSVVRPPLALDGRQNVYGVRTAQAVPATDPYMPRPTPSTDPKATLVAQPDLDRFTHVVDGRLPRPGSGAGTVEAAVTERTAHIMRLRTGSVVHLAEAGGAKLTVRITGVVRPQHAKASYWNAEPDLQVPTLSTVPGKLPPAATPEFYWHFTALVDERATGALLGLHEGVTTYWHHPADTDALTARNASVVVDRVTALTSGPLAARLQQLTGLRGFTVQEEGLATLVEPFGRERAATEPLIMVAAVGVGTVAVIVLLMAGELAAARRRTELTLMRARGAGLRGLAVRLLGESTLTAVPPAAAGLVLALLLIPTQRSAAAVWAASGVAAVASLAPPLRALLSVRAVRPGEPEDLVRARPSRRRTVAELTVVLVVTGAVLALRRRGTADGGLDLLTAAAPVLVAVVAAVVLLRLYPLPLRLLARPAARLRGAVLPLGVARAGRAPATATLPLLAVLVALTVTSFGGAVLSGVAAGRDRAALADVGADASIEAPAALPSGLAERVHRLGGVRDVAAVRIDADQHTERGGITYDLLMVDPASYARLAAVTGVDGHFPAAVLDGRRAGALAAVVSPRLATEFGRDPITMRTSAGPFDVRAVATRDAVPVVPDGRNFVIVSMKAVAGAHPEWLEASALEPTALYVTGGHVDGTALRTTAHQASARLAVKLRSQERAALKTTALQSGAQRVYLAVVAAGGGYCALALLLFLLQSSPQRRTALARLRTMGMQARQRQWLAVLDMLPQILLGAVGGMLTGLAVVPLLRPGVDLTALAFTSRPPMADVPAVVLDTDPLALVLPSAGLLAVACAVLAAQAWLTGRRGEGANLRMGDQT
ncbi:ABC transporter permease [Streptomyces sp. CA-106110]|uniref:ABC transporter permease n=1 Tax=Streptomyces sp. CA-106110 TaxID=3240044 RepID=UPI003D922AC7